MTYARWHMANGIWHMANGLWLMAYRLWQLKFQLKLKLKPKSKSGQAPAPAKARPPCYADAPPTLGLMAYGLWPMAYIVAYIGFEPASKSKPQPRLRPILNAKPKPHQHWTQW